MTLMVLPEDWHWESGGEMSFMCSSSVFCCATLYKCFTGIIFKSTKREEM